MTDPDDNAPEQPAAPASQPQFSPEQLQRAERVRSVMQTAALARTPEEQAAATAAIREILGVQAPREPEVDPDDLRAQSIREKLLAAMDGETDDDRAKSFGRYEEMLEYGSLKQRKAVRELAEKIADERAEAKISAMFQRLGIAPDDLVSAVATTKDAVWNPFVEKLGPEARKLIPAAKEVMRKLRAVGEDIDHEAALLIAAKGKLRPSAPAPEKKQPFFSSDAEEGPPARRGNLNGKQSAKPMSNAEIMASFNEAKEELSDRFGRIGAFGKKGL